MDPVGADWPVHLPRPALGWCACASQASRHRWADRRPTWP